MNVRPVLGDWEIPRIDHIESFERRQYVEFPIPGRVGSLFQDMNTTPTAILITGSLYGDETRNEMLEDVRTRFQSGEPLTFVADIVTATQIQYVIIEQLLFEEYSTTPDELRYQMLLLESPPPPPPPDPLGSLDSDLLDQAGSLVDSVAGALDVIDALGDIPDISDPTSDLPGALDSVTGATTGLDTNLSSLSELFGGGGG